MSTELVARPRSRSLAASSMESWQIMREQAGMLVKTGFLPETIKTPEQAVAIMMKGAELGIPPMYALSNIVIVKGKPTCSAELMLALIYRDHGDNAVVVQESSAEACVVGYRRRAWPSARQYAFTMQDAKTAGLLGNGTWQKYPAAMLRARCISAVARMAFPDSIAGMYTPEELGAEVVVIDGDELGIAPPPVLESETNGTAEHVAEIIEHQAPTAVVTGAAIGHPYAPNPMLCQDCQGPITGYKRTDKSRVTPADLGTEGVRLFGRQLCVQCFMQAKQDATQTDPDEEAF